MVVLLKLITHILRKKFLLLLVLVCATLLSFSQQPIKISGTVIDSAEKMNLQNASIVLIEAKDSTILSHVRTNLAGSFEIISNTSSNDLLLMITYPSFADFIQKIAVDKNKQLNLGNLYLTNKVHLLKEVIVKNTVSAIRVIGDTLEFKADSFHVSANADVQELLRKMPGLQVNMKGEISTQGQKVNKVLVDGEEFFSDDPAVVTKNIRADMVDKVQVFDKKSDQANLTGIDDGEKTKTINLKLKENKKNGYFGKLEAASNGSNYGNAKILSNYFSRNKKVSSFYSTDNTKFEALTWSESDKFSIENNNIITIVNDDGSYGFSVINDNNTGFPNQNIAGLVYIDKFVNYSTNNSGQFQRLITNTEGASYNKTLIQDSSFSRFTNSKGKNDRNRFKIGSINEWGTDSTTKIKLTIKASSTNLDGFNINSSQTVGESGALINTNQRQNSIHDENITFMANVLFNKKMAKKGRSISYIGDFNLDDRKQKNALISNIRYFNNGIINYKNDSINQLKNNIQDKTTITNTIIFSEPISTKASLIFKNSFSYGKNDFEMNTFDNKDSSIVNKIKIDSLTNHFIYDTYGNLSSITYSYLDKKNNLSFGSGYGFTSFKMYDLQRMSNKDMYFNNLIPNVNYIYSFTKQRKLRFNYFGRNINPSIQQIQPIIDNTDPLNIKVGNNDLKQAFSNSYNLNYTDFRIAGNRNFSIYANYSNINNAISKSTNVDVFGKTITKFINVDGNYYMSIGYNYFFEFVKNIQLSSSIFHYYSHNIDFINSDKNINISNRNNYSIGAFYNNDKSIVTAYFNITASNNISSSSIRPGKEVNAWNYFMVSNLGLKFEKKKFYINSSMEANIYSRTADFSKQNDMYVINTEAYKLFGKNDQFKINFTVYDLLDQNRYLERSVTSNFISESSNIGFKRRFLFTISYNFTKKNNN